ncbi:MAG: DUF167 domain-containing protein [Parcubacteria group bacterium]|nr:DUF167 domain-containing protein [Parcubacteria group bacterium]
MKIFVSAKPNAREESVEKISETTFIVRVKEPPVEGKANAAILSALAVYFNVPISSVRILSGHASKQKIIEVL